MTETSQTSQNPAATDKIQTSSAAQISQEGQFKRNVAFKLKIGEVISGKPVQEGDRLRNVEIRGKPVVRVNIIANIIDKFAQEGEKKYASITLDDASGQIRVKLFGDEIDKVSQLNQGDTVVTIGTLRIWNNELYITPEIIKKKAPEYLLVRKLELDRETPTTAPDKAQISELKDKIITKLKESEKDGGLEVETLILALKESPDHINQEIKKLLENGLAYEPRPGKIRWLG